MFWSTRFVSVIVISAALLSANDSGVSASSRLFATLPVPGAAASFLVLSGAIVTNTGPTTIAGDLGVSPGIADTPVPATPTPTLTPASTPTATRVIVLPVAGGPAQESDAPSRIPEVIALILGTLAALAIGSDPRAHHTPRN